MASKPKPAAFKPKGSGETISTYGIYVRSMLSMKVLLKITEIGRRVRENLERKIVQKTEGKCIAQGFIRPNSVNVVSYSSGNINSENVEFTVMYECLVCHPVENMRVDCVAKTITKAGVHAEVMTDGIVPLTIFLARDHNYTSREFDSIKENAKITVRILGIRYELNDPYICAIGLLVDEASEEKRRRKRPPAAASRVVVHEEAELGDLVKGGDGDYDTEESDNA